MNGGGGGDPIATAIQVHQLNATVGLLQVDMNDVNFGVTLIQALNDPHHVNRLAVIHNSLGQINASLGKIRAIMGRVIISHNDLVLILVHVELISGSVAEIHAEIAQFGLADPVLGLPLSPTLAGGLHIHTGFGSIQGSGCCDRNHPPSGGPSSTRPTQRWWCDVNQV